MNDDAWSVIIGFCGGLEGRLAVRLACRAACAGEERELRLRLLSTAPSSCDNVLPCLPATATSACPVRVVEAVAGRSMTPREALQWAAMRGSVAALDRLAREPYLLGRVDAVAVGALPLAVTWGRAAVVDRLALPPYSLNHDDAVDCDALMHTAEFTGTELHDSDAGPVAAVMDRLAEPPYSLGHDHAVSVLAGAAFTGRLDVVDRLVHPPYSVTRTDALECHALMEAACMGRCAIISRLALPPFELGKADAGDALLAAVSVRQFGAVRRLEAPPYSLCVLEAVRDRHSPSERERELKTTPD